MANATPHPPPAGGLPLVEVQLCMHDEQTRHMPRRSRAPVFLSPTFPIPRQGEVVYLHPTSPWAVQLVVHQWRTPTYLRVEVWLTHLGSTRARADFVPTM